MTAKRPTEEYEGWVKTGDAARRLGISTQRLTQLIDKKRLEVKWTPYGRLISEASLQKYDRDRRNHQWAEVQRQREAERAATVGAA